jgi:DNA-binding NarL/FixJ family response regulator
LVADDHPGVVGHLRGLLSPVPGITVVAEAAGARDAVDLALRHRPDVLLLDLRMSDGSGIDVIREVHREAPRTAVLVFTACDDDESVLTAMRAGVRGYILKCAADEDIVRAVRGVACGEAIFGQTIAHRVLSLLVEPPASAAPMPVLTARERELAALLAAGHGNAAIARRLERAPKTVSNQVSALVAKLGVADRSAAISRVRAIRDCR